MAKRRMKIRLARQDPAEPGTVGRLHIRTNDVDHEGDFRFVGRVTSGALAFIPAERQAIYVTDEEVVSFTEIKP